MAETRLSPKTTPVICVLNVRFTTPQSELLPTSSNSLPDTKPQRERLREPQVGADGRRRRERPTFALSDCSRPRWKVIENTLTHLTCMDGWWVMGDAELRESKESEVNGIVPSSDGLLEKALS